MSKTIVVCGYGSGISDAVAHTFGRQGFQVALVARSEDKLIAGAERLAKAGITAKAFPCDLGDTASVTSMIATVRKTLGPITVLHYNAYAGAAGDLLTSSDADLRKTFDVSVTGLVTAVQGAHADLKSQPGASAVLVTGGGFAFYSPQVDHMAVQYDCMGLAVAKAAQHKLVGLLHDKLAADGIYVGEVVVLGMVRGTAFDPQGQSSLEASAVADRFWDIYTGRSEASVNIQ